MHESNAPLMQALIGLGATITHAMNSLEDFVPCGHPAEVIIAALSRLDDNLSDAELSEQEAKVAHLTAHVSQKRGVPAHNGIGLCQIGSLKRDLLEEVIQIAQLMQPKGTQHQTINAWIYRALAAMESENNAAAQERILECESVKAAAALL